MKPLPVIILRDDKRKCKHFRAMGEHDTCAAGVKYADVRKEGETIEYRHNAKETGTPYSQKASMPCHAKWNLHGAVCEKCEYPTPEEIAAKDEQHKRSFEGIMLARKAIVEHCGGPWKKGMPGLCGSLECPCCKGILRFSRAGYNGHVHAHCETKGCVSWME